jgi:hypothetical protein
MGAADQLIFEEWKTRCSKLIIEDSLKGGQGIFKKGKNQMRSGSI